MRIHTVVVMGLGLLIACAPAEGDAVAAASCEPDTRMALEGRASPYDSATIDLGSAQAKVCYGRPSARGRTMIGGEHVPYGRLWRTGANEPTVLHLPVAAEVAGIPVDAGSYSLYTVPGRSEWEVILNASTTHWGVESRYTGEVRAEEVGRGTAVVEAPEELIETFTIRMEEGDGAGADMLLEWERTRVRIPITPAD